MIDYKNMKSEGGYVFISHAHKDIHEIRRIRNFLEENGLEPICFYLRCLSDDDEILDLIKREIDAREWFLLVDSKNARESKWVQTEIEYIKKKDSKKMISVSLDKQEEIEPILIRLSKTMRVFLSYSHKDQIIAQAIYNECIKHDLKVFDEVNSIKSGESWEKSVSSAIKDAAKQGCVVLIISENAVTSKFVRDEMYFAISLGAYVLPVIVGDVDLPPEFKFCLSRLPRKQFYRLSMPASEEQISEIVKLVEKISLKRLKDNFLD